MSASCRISAAPSGSTARHALKNGQIDGALGMAFMGYHLIQFTREALRGDQNASYYSAKKRTAADGGRRSRRRASRSRRRRGCHPAERQKRVTRVCDALWRESRILHDWF